MADQRRAYAEAITDMIGLSKCRAAVRKGSGFCAVWAQNQSRTRHL